MKDWFCITCRKVVAVEHTDIPEMFQEIIGRFSAPQRTKWTPEGEPICPDCNSKCFKINQDSAAETEPKQK